MVFFLKISKIKTGVLVRGTPANDQKKIFVIVWKDVQKSSAVSV